MKEIKKIHNFILYVCENFCDTILLQFRDSGTVNDYGSDSDFLTSYGSGSTQQKVTVPTVPFPQHWLPRTLHLPRPMTRTACQPVWLVADMQVFWEAGDLLYRTDQTNISARSY
jgi:hypothetical protein